MPDLRSRFPTTYALLCAIDLCPPHIELEDVPSLKRAPPGLHSAELKHWLLTLSVWTNPAPASRSWDLIVERTAWERSG